MNSKEVLIFDISGEYGHYRKYNTTTSPLTYSIPTRTAIAGLLGAILGMEREIGNCKYRHGTIPVQEFFSKEKANIAIQIINPIKKVNVGFNLINTKTSFNNLTKAGHTQIDFELLKDVKYRIYLTMDATETFKELCERIKNKRHHFTPYLGLAQFTSIVDFVKQTTVIKKSGNDNFININTAINMTILDKEQPINFKPNLSYAANNMPITMNRDREILEYSDVLIEKNGEPLNVKAPYFYTIDNFGNILFL